MPYQTQIVQTRSNQTKLEQEVRRHVLFLPYQTCAGSTRVLTKLNLCRKYAGPALDLDNFEVHQKIPLTAYGRPGFLSVLYQLVW